MIFAGVVPEGWDMSGFAYLAYEDEHGVPEIESVDEIQDFDHSAIDFDHLQRFTLGNRSLEEEVLNLFRTQTVIYMDRLGSAENDTEWHSAAHTIKGSALGIGATRVGEAAGRCEKLHGPDRATSGENAVKQLQKRLEEANFLIAKYLND